MQRLLKLIPADVKRIDLLAPPFSGHLHPILAMGRALMSQYQIRIISTQGAQERIRAAGLEGVALPGDYDQLLQSVANPQYAIKSNPLYLYRQFRSVVNLLSQFAHELETLYQQEERPQLVIADFTLAVVGPVCEKLKLPWWTSLPSPCVLESLDGVPAYCGGLFPANNRYERLIHTLHRKKIRWFKSTIFWLFRHIIRQTGITQLYRADHTENIYSPTRILALGEKEFEFPQHWPDSVSFIGPALYSPPSEIEPPYFQPNKRHVLITLGTHLDWHKEAVMQAVKKLALTLPDWIFHFTNGHWDGHSRSEQDNFIQLPWVDYDRYLACYDVVIHHGGSGILWHCLRHQLPALVYPVDYDQFDNAARLDYSGKGIWLKGGLVELENAKNLLIKLVN